MKTLVTLGGGGTLFELFQSRPDQLVLFLSMMALGFALALMVRDKDILGDG
jgi:hypothetical protein